MALFIETERTVLRPFQEGDADAAFAWFSDPEVMRFIPSGPDKTIDESRHRIARYREHEAKHGFSKRLILLRETGEPIGDAGLYYLQDGLRIELGFRLARQHWGQGYASEVARGWLAWFDAHLAGRPLFADVHPDHTRSQRVLAKLGFHRTDESIEVSGMTMLIYRQIGR